jgi:SAM-dependent methyltransferase
MSIWGWRYVYLLRLYRLIELIRPKRIIEVGCGSGFFPSILACRFPNIELHGVELTVEGVRSAQDGQKLDQLPQPLVEFSPEPLIDLSGHKRVVFHRASAREMPFENASFDLVYTICSMEQMELIRRSALGEISRITGRYLSNFECFRDVNMIGLQRKYIQAMNYYEGSISELEEFRLRPIYIDDDMPQKFYMNVAHVICEKIR